RANPVGADNRQRRKFPNLSARITSLLFRAESPARGCHAAAKRRISFSDRRTRYFTLRSMIVRGRLMLEPCLTILNLHCAEFISTAPPATFYVKMNHLRRP